MQINTSKNATANPPYWQQRAETLIHDQVEYELVPPIWKTPDSTW